MQTKIVTDWQGSSIGAECSLHQISPYIGKMKSTMAASLIHQFTAPGSRIYDPYVGSGTIALEAWRLGRQVVASDLSPYAVTLSKAKLFPPITVENALEEIERCESYLRDPQSVDLRRVPIWVRKFFHPETLRETISWVEVLRRRRSHFLLSNLLGILHHQIPGFLSFPSSHTVPYLRTRAFPPHRFPEMYEYRSVRNRLERKVNRSLRKLPLLDFQLERKCYRRDSIRFLPKGKVDAIITSPPYMRRLDYARDNRLRLWFLGVSSWKALDARLSPRESDFIRTMKYCLETWKCVLKNHGICVLVVGDSYCTSSRMSLPEVVKALAVNAVGGYSLVSELSDPIPSERRVRRGHSGNLAETILVLRAN
jgi:hypothetical protein